MKKNKIIKNIVKVLKTIGKILILGLLVYLFIGIYYYSKFLMEQHQKENVEIMVKLDLVNCPNKYPLYMEITNNSDKVISFVSFRLKIFQKGRSTDIASSISYSSDYFILPTENKKRCSHYIPKEHTRIGKLRKIHMGEDFIKLSNEDITNLNFEIDKESIEIIFQDK